MVRFLVVVSGLCLLPSFALAENSGLAPESDPSLPVRAAKSDRLIRVVSVDRPTDAVRPKLLRKLNTVEEVAVNSK